MSICFGRFRASGALFGGLFPGSDGGGCPGPRGRGPAGGYDAVKKGPGSDPRPLPDRILEGFPVSRYYLRRTIFFMFS